MRNELHARHPRRRPSARIAMLAGAMIAGYVPRTMAGDLGPLCPLPGYPDRRCLVAGFPGLASWASAPLRLN